MAPIEVPAMTLGLMPSSSNTSSIRMWASPRAPPPPSASAIVGRPTGSVGLRTCRALPGGFMGAVIPGVAPSIQRSRCIGFTGWQGDRESAPYLIRPANRGSVRLISGMQMMSVRPIKRAQI